jgi:desulfoferrodoxin (superoxide reductase-like protein)
MKKIFLQAITVVLFLSVSAWAHAPKKIDITVKDKLVEIKIEHPVRDPFDHYVRRITVKHNGVQVAKENFVRQDKDEQLFEIKIPELKKGDKIEVTARCSEFGKKIETLIVE